jgi:hypothetical protein
MHRYPGGLLDNAVKLSPGAKNIASTILFYDDVKSKISWVQS